MAKTTIIISASGLTVTLGSTTLGEVVSVAFPLFGDRDEINLTTIDAVKYEQKLLGDLQKLPDIVVTKKSDPTNDAALHSEDSEALVIGYKIGGSTEKTVTYYAQLKNISPSTIERAPGDGVNVDLTFFVTNLNELAEDGPTIN